MTVFAGHLVNTSNVPHDELCNVLVHAKPDMKTNPRLEPLDDPFKNMWAYFPVMRITPIVIDDFLLLILTIPFIDKSLQIN